MLNRDDVVNDMIAGLVARRQARVNGPSAMNGAYRALVRAILVDPTEEQGTMFVPRRAVSAERLIETVRAA
ncbi:MAG: hypothetical protein JOZ81_27590 [Chloroflexi bacterium]|nr:hypothetical protein [Chloroflexota bacterium]